MVCRSGPTSGRRLPTAADEADVIIGVRGVLGNLNATPCHQEQGAWTVPDACHPTGPRQPDAARSVQSANRAGGVGGDVWSPSVLSRTPDPGWRGPSAPDAANDSLALLIRAQPPQLEHAVRLQTLMMSPRSKYGSLDPRGQLLLTLKPAEQNATNADFAELADRLVESKPAQRNPITLPYSGADK